jgi:two-component system chemotaxis sensor kinase CheA
MGLKEEEFLKKLIQTYKIEAAEHIQNMTTCLIDIEKSDDKEAILSIVETVYRDAHSLKGASRAVNFKTVESICQSLETVFAGMKKNDITLSKEGYDLIHYAISTINKIVTETILKENENILSESEKIKNLLSLVIAGENDELKTLKFEEKITAEAPSSSSKADTIRISASKLESIFLQTEEMLSIKLTNEHVTKQLNDLIFEYESWKKEWNKIQPDLRKFKDTSSGYNGKEINKNESLKSVVSFLDWNQSYINKSVLDLNSLARITYTNNKTFGSTVNGLLDDIKKIMLLPFSALTELLPLIVRDISQNLGRETDLIINGQELEIDKRILDELKDPIIHIIRNCIDHGIEPPDEREIKKKKRKGLIELSINRISDNKVEIKIKDDGKGIDTEKVINSVLTKGLITEEERGKLTEKDILAFLFKSDISTSTVITDISGRGLGLAIVKEKIEIIGGSISINSKENEWTEFDIILPMTLANFRGVVISLDENIFVIPTVNIERILRIKAEEIKTVENRETISTDGIIIPVFNLKDVLGLGAGKQDIKSNSYVNILLLRSSEKQIAFIIDNIMNEQEILLKHLGKQLRRIKNIYGATILGSGKVALILNAQDLINSADNTAAVIKKITKYTDEKEESLNILVVDDSVTSRMLLKDILESSGYNVKTAIDGIDAFTLIKTEKFNLIVSDIEMPRMDGFELTKRIRSDNKFKELPVILITALSSPEDREKGIDAGANAYIVKSDFEQSNLLDIIKRLI